MTNPSTVTNGPEVLGQMNKDGLGSLKSLEGKNELQRLVDAARAVYDHRYGMGAPMLVIYDELIAAADAVSSGVLTPGNSNGGKGEHPMRDGYIGSAMLSGPESHKVVINYATREQADAAHEWLTDEGAAS